MSRSRASTRVCQDCSDVACRTCGVRRVDTWGLRGGRPGAGVTGCATPASVMRPARMDMDMDKDPAPVECGGGPSRGDAAPAVDVAVDMAVAPAAAAAAAAAPAVRV